MKDPAARAQYEERAERSLSGQRSEVGSDSGLTLAKVKEALANERAEADAWYAAFAARETGWVRDEVDPEVQIRDLYAGEIRITGDVPVPKRSKRPIRRPPLKTGAPAPEAAPGALEAFVWPLVGLVAFVAAGVTLGLGLRRPRRKRA